MNQQEQYRLAKEAREGEKFAQMAKDRGYFSKQEVHNICAACLVDFLQQLTTSPCPIIVGQNEDTYQLNRLVDKFQESRMLDPNAIDPNTWADEIKKV